ncbi:24660_t:CDS:2 [Cetraspora pellucida]|uniref:24660_t:CDS:1 n=1 Tax=Cetraspora pellucida TaxID=1433469 RepID=A0A9N9JM14_9GLOM|nr:24660_t:CDS:2 [Cetraspora pellucida]
MEYIENHDTPEIWWTTYDNLFDENENKDKNKNEDEDEDNSFDLDDKKDETNLNDLINRFEFL